MQLWALRLDTLDATLASAVATVGLGSGVGIILVTLLLRLSLAPLSGTVAYRSALRRHQLTRLKPEIDSLQSAYCDRPEQMRMVMIVVPAVLTIMFALKFASGRALYWIVSNAFAVVQSLIVNALVKRQLRATA